MNENILAKDWKNVRWNELKYPLPHISYPHYVFAIKHDFSSSNQPTVNGQCELDLEANGYWGRGRG